MKNNLKKVISTLIALTFTLSSVAAFAATSFSDVADTANYANAVKKLAALGIVKGYDENGTVTFKPDNNITRAEVATMVVAAVNKSAAAKGMEGTTEFSDMNNEAKKWASGYVNQGVADKFIAGFEDKTFRPDENVTYAQIISMLVRVLGYGEYANYLGGWPTGYISIGQTEGITVGVSANANDVVTRAQVAQLISNALSVPMVTQGSMVYTNDGKYVPEIKKQDGTDDTFYKTILTEKFNAYAVKGMVTQTNRTHPSKYDSNEVYFQIYDGEKYNNTDLTDASASSTSWTYYDIDATIGDTDASSHIFTYADAIVRQDDNDDWSILSFIPSGRNKSVEVDADLFSAAAISGYTINDKGQKTVATNASYNVKYTTSASSSKTTTYRLASDFELYVNGVKIDAANFTDEFVNYVALNEFGKVTMLDACRYNVLTDKIVNPDGDYDYIFVTSYATARVDAVTGSVNRVTFKDQISAAANQSISSSIELDEERVKDGDLAYSVFYNGAEIKATDLREDDIISIAYDVNGSLKDSSFYEIYVSREVVEGKFSGKNTTDKVITFAGKEYEFVGDFDTQVAKAVLADEYTAYVDYLGRIFTLETNVSSAKYAVIDRYAESSSYDEWIATLYLTDGTVKNQLEVDTAKVGLTQTAIKNLVYKADGSKQPIQDRVVKYKLSTSTGKVITLDFVDSNIEETTGTGGEYLERTTSIGSIKMSDATKIIDATQYVKKAKTTTPTTTELKTASLTSFTNGSDYKAFAFGDRFTDGSYPFVLVTEGNSIYTDTTRFAVITKTMGTADVDGDDYYDVTVAYDGATDKVFIVSDEATIDGKNIGDTTTATSVNYTTALGIGDVIFFTLDASGYIDQINVIFQAKSVLALDGTGQSAYDTFVGNALTPAKDAISIPADATEYFSNKWAKADRSSDQTSVLAFGPVVDKTGSSFVLGKVVTANLTDTNGVVFNGTLSGVSTTDKDATIPALNVATDSNTKVYVYNFQNNSRYAVELGSAGSVTRTSIPSTKKYTSSGKEFVAWDVPDAEKEMARDDVKFAFAKVTNGVATDVLVFIRS